jgi:hypothetical protein
MELDFIPTLITETSLLVLLAVVFIHFLLGGLVVRLAKAAAPTGRHVAYAGATLMAIAIVGTEAALAPHVVGDSVEATLTLIQAAAVGGTAGAGVAVVRELQDEEEHDLPNVGQADGTADSEIFEPDGGDQQVVDEDDEGTEPDQHVEDGEDTESDGLTLPDVGFEIETDEDGYPVFFRSSEETEI